MNIPKPLILLLLSIVVIFVLILITIIFTNDNFTDYIENADLAKSINNTKLANFFIRREYNKPYRYPLGFNYNIRGNQQLGALNQYSIDN